jgi:hypothetical protein
VRAPVQWLHARRGACRDWVGAGSSGDFIARVEEVGRSWRDFVFAAGTVGEDRRRLRARRRECGWYVAWLEALVNAAFKESEQHMSMECTQQEGMQLPFAGSRACEHTNPLIAVPGWRHDEAALRITFSAVEFALFFPAPTL